MSRASSTFSPDMTCPSVGSATTSVLSRDEAKQLFKRTQERWSQTNDQLTSAIRERTTSPLNVTDIKNKDIEIANLRRELSNIQTQMDQYRQQLQVAEATILQQQATIRNQSKAIENPRPGRDGPVTPRHSHNYGPYEHMQSHNAAPSMYAYQNQQGPFVQTPSMRSVYGPIPPAHTNPALNNSFATINSAPFVSSSAAHTPQPATRIGFPTVDEYGSPQAYRSAPPSTPTFQRHSSNQHAGLHPNWQNTSNSPFGPAQPSSTSQCSSAGNPQMHSSQSFASPDSVISNPYPETSIPSKSLILSSVAINEAKIKESFHKVFDMAQQYARTHANHPSTIGEYALPQAVKDRLLNAATNTTAFGLMSDRSTRYLLISKVMIQWIVKHILKYNTFSGFDNDVDQIINGARAAIYQSTPAQLRFLLLTNIANEVKKLHGRSGFAAYVDHLSQQRANQLIQLIRPMMHQKTVGEWQDLVIFLQEAYNLARLMFEGTDEFSFDFPANNQKYDTSQMISIDPMQIGYGAVGSKEIQFYVRLGTTPFVKIRKNMSHGEGPSQIMVKSKVLLKKTG